MDTAVEEVAHVNHRTAHRHPAEVHQFGLEGEESKVNQLSPPMKKYNDETLQGRGWGVCICFLHSKRL